MAYEIQDTKEFQEMIDRAKSNTSNEWEEGFVHDIEERFTKYKEKTRVSDKQYAVLHRISVAVPKSW